MFSCYNHILDRRVSNHHRGFTLIDVALSLTIMAIIALGAINLRVHGDIQLKRGDVYHNAMHLGEVFLEAWHTQNPPASFDPYDLTTGLTGSEIAMDTDRPDSGPAAPDGFTPLGGESFLVTFDGVTYFMTLAYQDQTATRPAVLCAGVGWRNDYRAGDYVATDPVIWLTVYR